MIAIDLGPGFAPDVGFWRGDVYVAFGTKPNLQVRTVTPQGAPIATLAFDGFFDSFPRITGGVLVYKAIAAAAFPAKALRLDTGRLVAFPPSADGNWPCVVVDANTVAWQSTTAWNVWLGSLVTGLATPTALHGVGDGIESVGNGTVVCRKDIRLQDPSVGGYPSYAGDLTVGQYGYGIGVRLTGQAVRWIAGDPADDHADPRCATDGTNYAIVCWGKRGARLYLGTRAQLLALPLVPMDIPIPPDPVPPDPIPPDPVPPDPPVPLPPAPVPPQPPTRPYRLHKEHKTMADTIVVARGPGGKLARPDNTHTGPWAAQGWRGLVFDGSDKSDARYRFVRRGSALISQQTGAVIGCDATLHSGGLNSQFYVKPDGDTGQGWAETWQFYEGNANGAIEAQIEYAPGSGGDEGPFFSYPLAIEVVG